MKQAKDIVRKAQEAEVAGRKIEAAAYLREAANVYAESNLVEREQKMLRHAERLEAGDEWGFGDSLLAGGSRENAIGLPLMLAPEAPNLKEHVTWLPWQASAAKRMEREKLVLPLIFGPSGSGKHFFSKYFLRNENTILLSEKQPPAPSMTLEDGSGLFDTNALHQALPQYSIDRLSKVDAVFIFTLPTAVQMYAVLKEICLSKGLQLSQSVMEHVCQIAEQSGRSMHELISLVARIPKP
jgi:hypothetical protein